MEKDDRKMGDKISKKPIQESMKANMTSIKISTEDKKNEVKELGPVGNLGITLFTCPGSHRVHASILRDL